MKQFEADSLTISLLTLQSAEKALVGETYTLNHSPVPGYSFSNSNDSTVLKVNIGTKDLNAIKKIYQLATTENNTFISITEDGVNDMVGLTLEPILKSNAKEVLKYTEDSESPVLLRFSLDLTTEILSLTFDETVNVNSLEIDKFTILSSADDDNGTVYVDLKDLTDLSYDNSTVVEFRLDYDDLNDIKLETKLATNEINTWLRLLIHAIDDMAYDANPINLTLQKVNKFSEDEIEPNLKSFFVNLDEGIIVLNFDEPINSSSVNCTAFTLYSGTNTTGSGDSSGSAEYPFTFYTLTGGSTNSSNGLQITIMLTEYDLNNIKLDEYLFTNKHTSYLSITEEAIRDMNDNQVNSVDLEEAIMAYDYISDTTPPVVLRFDLDMNTGMLVLYFPETIDVSTTDFEGIVIQKSSNVTNNINQYMLTDGSLNMINDGVKAYIQITHYDLNEIKQRRIALSNTTTWLTAEQSTLLDMNGQPLSPLVNAHSAKVVSQYISDQTRPELRSFVLDMNANTLFLSFSETVDGENLNVSAITLQDTRNGNNLFNHYTLTEDSSYVNTSYGPNVTIVIGLIDINTINEFVELAFGEESTFISITSQLVLDIFDNPVRPISSSYALPVSTYVDDATSPQLDYYDLDMNDKTLSLYFSETVNGSTLNITAFTLYEAPENDFSEQRYTFQSSDTSTEYDSMVVY